jgi:hypothetical protein
MRVDELGSVMKLTEKMSSKESLDQHVQLTEEEDLRDLLMIGGI